MSQGYRIGTPTIATQTAAGTLNDQTDPRIVEFAGTYARPCIVHNLTGGGNAIRVKINSTATDFTAEASFFSINDGFAVDVSMGGLVNVQTVLFTTLDAGDSLDDVQVVGWTV